jgi:hypothetical protein
LLAKSKSKLVVAFACCRCSVSQSCLFTISKNFQKARNFKFPSKPKSGRRGNFQPPNHNK